MRFEAQDATARRCRYPYGCPAAYPKSWNLHRLVLVDLRTAQCVVADFTLVANSKIPESIVCTEGGSASIVKSLAIWLKSMEVSDDSCICRSKANWAARFAPALARLAGSFGCVATLSLWTVRIIPAQARANVHNSGVGLSEESYSQTFCASERTSDRFTCQPLTVLAASLTFQCDTWSPLQGPAQLAVASKLHHHVFSRFAVQNCAPTTHSGLRCSRQQDI